MGSEPDQPELAPSIATVLDETGTPGAVIEAIVDGACVIAEGVGYRDFRRTTAIDGSESFYLYSVTKTLLAIAAMRLAEQGRVVLDDPIQRTLPEIGIESPVTVRHLLSHTGGLPDYSTVPAYFEALRDDPTTPWTTQDFLRQALDQGFAFPPGHGWAYSNVGYMLVRLMVERISGVRLQQAFNELIFEPLGLRWSFVAERLDDTRTLVPGYSKQLNREGCLEEVSQRYHPGWVSHGVVISTAHETAQILEALCTGGLLGEDAVRQMLDATAVPATHPFMRKPGYGLGLMVDLDSPYGLVAGHAGGGPGYSAAAFHFSGLRGHRVTAVALANSDTGDVATRIVFALAQQFFDRTQERTRRCGMPWSGRSFQDPSQAGTRVTASGIGADAGKPRGTMPIE